MRGLPALVTDIRRNGIEVPLWWVLGLEAAPA